MVAEWLGRPRRINEKIRLTDLAKDQNGCKTLLEGDGEKSE